MHAAYKSSWSGIRSIQKDMYVCMYVMAYIHVNLRWNIVLIRNLRQINTTKLHKVNFYVCGGYKRELPITKKSYDAAAAMTTSVTR